MSLGYNIDFRRVLSLARCTLRTHPTQSSSLEGTR